MSCTTGDAQRSITGIRDKVWGYVSFKLYLLILGNKMIKTYIYIYIYIYMFMFVISLLNFILGYKRFLGIEIFFQRKQ